MKKTKQNIFLNIFIAFLAILVCFIIIEIVLRFIKYDYKKSPGPKSSYIIETREYKIQVMTNSLNIRDYEIHPKTKNEVRVLCIGDSFTFGLGVDMEDTYAKVAEKLLNEGGERFYVINGSRGNFAGKQYDFLIKEGLELKPDLVIVQIFIGNYFYDAKPYLDSKIISLERKSENLLLRLKKLLSIKCYTASFIWHRLIQIEYLQDFLFRFHLRYTERGIFLREYPKLERRLIEAELEYLEKINDLCQNRGIKVLFMTIPSEAQLFKKCFLNNEKYYYKKPNEIIKEFCQMHNIIYIDLLDKYEKLPYKDVRSFYYRLDPHWTVQGHRYAAEVLVNLIKDELSL